MIGQQTGESELNKEFYDVTMTTLLKEIFQKQLLASKVEMDLINKLEGKTEVVTSHGEVIKSCRKAIDTVDSMLKDIKHYLVTLKLADLYSLFQTMFRILVYNVKKLSECYLRRFEYAHLQNSEQINLKRKTFKQIEALHDQSETQKCTCKYDQIKKMQHLDAIIAGVEAHESTIEYQMFGLMKDLEESKIKIENMNASSNQYVYNQVETAFRDISRKADNMFNNFVKGISDNQAKVIFLEPEAFEQQVIEKLKHKIGILSQKKFRHLKEVINSAIELKKTVRASRYHNSLSNLDEPKKKNFSQYYYDNAHEVNQSQPIDMAARFEMKDEEIEKLKQINVNLQSEIAELKETIKQQQIDSDRLLNENKAIQIQFKKRNCEYETCKQDLKWQLQRVTKENEMLIAENAGLEEKLKRIIVVEKIVKPVEAKETQTSDKELKSEEKLEQKDCDMNGLYKNRRRGFFLDLRVKKRNMEAERALKKTVEALSQMLSRTKEGKEKDHEEVVQMLKDSRYEELIQRIKNKLDYLYKEAFFMDLNTSEEKHETFSPSKDRSSFKEPDQLYNEIGVQTSEQIISCAPKYEKNPTVSPSRNVSRKISANHMKLSKSGNKNERIINQSSEGSEYLTGVGITPINHKSHISSTHMSNHAQSSGFCSNLKPMEGRKQTAKNRNSGINNGKAKNNVFRDMDYASRKSQTQIMFEKLKTEGNEQNNPKQKKCQMHLSQATTSPYQPQNKAIQSNLANNELNKNQKQIFKNNLKYTVQQRGSSALFEEIRLTSQAFNDNELKKQMMLEKLSSKGHRRITTENEFRAKKNLKQLEKEANTRSNIKLKEIMIDMSPGMETIPNNSEIGENLKRTGIPKHQRYMSCLQQ